jgi:hypothetical protein
LADLCLTAIGSTRPGTDSHHPVSCAARLGVQRTFEG